MSDLYKILGVSRGADAKDIKRAYFDLAKTNHPDKGGNEEDFKSIQHAYDILSDSEKRSMYDMTGNANPSSAPQQQHSPFPFGGMPGMPGGMPGMPGMHFDIGSMFGNMFGNKTTMRQEKRPKGANKVHEIALCLRDFYYGKSLRIDLERQVFCTDCSGKGYLTYNNCSDCKGSGIKESLIQIGPGMMAVNRGPCGTCRGEGVTKGNRCNKCDTKGLVNQIKMVDVKIEPGALPGDILTFEGICSDHPDFHKPGDMIIKLVSAEEDLDIIRDGQSLVYNCSVSLKESLLGCKRSVTSHPAHTTGLLIDIPHGTQSNETVCIKGNGMIKGSSVGDLLVRVTVVVTNDDRKILETNRLILQNLFE
jgi:DnaJ family protein A protein 2